jgi:hypothetical protein
MKKLNQVLAVTLSLAIATTATPWKVYAAPVEGPAFLHTFTPPSRLGYVTSSFQGKTAQPIVMIQDLHANYGVQKKIVDLLKFMQPNAAPKGSAMVLGREAAWNQVDLSFFTTLAPKDRKRVLDILMKNAEVSAKEHFAAMSETPVNVMGIDDKDDYLLALGLVRRSASARYELATKVNKLNEAIKPEIAKAPADLRRLLKAEQDYRNGTLSMEEMARKLHVDTIPTYDFLENRLLDRKVELASKAGKDSGTLQNAIVADHFLSLLSRLLRQQMTLEEVKMVARESERIETIVHTFLPKEDLNEWNEIINAAVDYYAIAMMRDKPLADNSVALAASHPEQPIVVVVGGFHTAGMEQMLREQNVSFMTIAPVVESHTMTDEMLYLKRILGNHMDSTEITSAVNDSRAHTADLTDTLAPNTGLTGIDPTVAQVSAEVTGHAPSAPTVTPADHQALDTEGDKPKGDVEHQPVPTGRAAYKVTMKDTERKIDPAVQAMIDKALGFFSAEEAAKLRAKIASGELTFVLEDHYSAATTYRNVDGTGKTVVVLDKTFFAKGGNVALINVGKELVNNLSDKATEEADTLPKLFQVFGSIGLDAIKTAYGDMYGGTGILTQAIDEIVSKGLGDPTKWATGDVKVVSDIIKAAVAEIERQNPGFTRDAVTQAPIEHMPIPTDSGAFVSPHRGTWLNGLANWHEGVISRFTSRGDLTPKQRKLLELAKKNAIFAAA